MKFVSVLLVCCTVVIVFADNNIDNIDIDEILANKRLLNAYVDCVMERGKCTPEGKNLKENIQEGIETGCAKCTEPQEKKVYKVIEHLINKELAIWHELTAKFDPDGVWRKKYEARAKANGIQILE